MAKQIWLIGGTQESVAIATALREAEVPFIVTVTTDAAQAMYAIAPAQSSQTQAPQCQIHVGPIAADAMATWLCSQQIAGVLDASHPFATAVSAGAIAAATQAKLPYLRFERLVVRSPQTDGANSRVPSAEWINLVPDLETLLTAERLADQRVLLVLGYRMLHYFRPWQTRSSLFARILPSPVALEAALEAGFTSDRLIALRPPLSLELERSLWQQWGITQVVAKCSGQAGGERTKRAVAAELGVRLWLIQRPLVDYPEQTDCIEVAIAFARRALNGRDPSSAVG